MSKTSNSAGNSVSGGGKGSGRLVAFVVVAAAVVFGLSGWAWWHNVRSDPQRTLYGAIENSLRTRSVTRQVVQKSGAQTLEQGIGLSLSPVAQAHGFTTMQQNGEVNATVKTEVISSASGEYTRYSAINTDQKSAKGKVMNFSAVLNIWGKSSSDQTGQPGELYGESLLGVVPSANLSATNRQAVMQTVRDNNVYDFDEKSVERKLVDGRPTYVYNVTVQPVAYIKLLKQFGGLVGFKQLEALNPEQYKDAQALTFKLTVDVWGQKLTGIEYAGGVRTEHMGSYGVHKAVKPPQDSIPAEELQAKLQQVQQ
ncbi:MAG TPA: hypothetical protein VK674_07600 [Candidatus Limnocylindria bacterium]|nr:hypothetical protein [Candidatus Limnocylindria bacterium]